MRLHRFIFAAVMLTLCKPAVARLGETLQECEARYGTLLRTMHNRESAEFPLHLFQKGNIAISVIFLDGRSVREDFVPVEDDPKPMTDAQIDEILTANSEGSIWQVGSVEAFPMGGTRRKAFSRKDGLAKGSYESTAGGGKQILTVERVELAPAMKKSGAGF